MPRLKDQTRRHGTRTVYVANDDVTLWNDAVKFCESHNVPLSRFVADAIYWYLVRVSSPGE